MSYPPPPGQDPYQPPGQPQYGQQPYPGQPQPYPGQYQQPPQPAYPPGQYGPPQYPGGYPQGGGYPPPQRSRKGLWIGLSVVAVLAIVGTLVAIGLSGGDDKKKDVASSSSAVPGAPTPSAKSSSGSSSAPRTGGAQPPTSPVRTEDGGDPPVGNTQQKQYLDLARNMVPSLKSKSDAELIALGKGICSDLRAGKSFQELAMAQPDPGSWAMAGGLAVGGLCPDQRSKLKG
ncbi:DUF732 domain-containing protein [Embleya sp. AB8]|uniref:DUF732 domain-containing protein n=1 Tax=Embleya sp. AB8 TaxID=3156304 RepID=UPI003C710F34